MTPEFHPLAEAELNDAAGFYEAAAVGLGGGFLNEIERLVALVYQVLGERIFDLAMAHQRREPQYWAERLG